jgi:hypothetical protein
MMILKKRDDAMRRLWAFLMFLGFSVSLVIHFSLYFVNLSTISPKMAMPSHFILLHMGTLIALFTVMPKQKERKRNMYKNVLASLAHAPKWAQSFAWVFWAYAILNFIVHFVAMISLIANTDGMTSIYGMRIFTGHWMAFYSMGLVYFAFPLRNEKTKYDELVA